MNQIIAGALVLATAATISTAEPLSVSGIYPHLTVFNSDPKREQPEMECGLGAAVAWAGRLWSMTYTSHALGRGSDKLFAVLPDMTLEIRPKSVGGTSACRLIHRESKQLFIASCAIDAAGKVRVIPRDKLPGRLTALARHLTDTANKVLYLTQEGAVYDVDVHSLAVTELFKKPLPGWHYKGAWTAQGRFFVAANGEEPAPAPFWKVDYTSAATKFETEKLTWQYLQTPYQPLATPNIDRLAREVVRFTDAHLPSAVCTPTRYTLLTGRFAWWTRLQRNVLGPNSQPLIAEKQLTVAGLLR